MLSRWGLIAALCLFLIPIHHDAQASDDVGAVIVTVTGNIGETNRGPSDPFADGLFSYHYISFEKAYAFSREDLAALGLKDLTVKYPNWPGEPIRFRGALMSAILDKVDARGSTVRVQALDGYAVEFDVDTLRNGDFILATESEGQPLAVGARGPAWLVFPPGSYEGQPEDTDEKLVWSVFHIAVE